MSFSDMNDPNCSPVSETPQDKIKLFLTSISAEETKLAHEIQASVEKIQSASHLLSEQYKNNPSKAIADLIRRNRNIEQELKESIKKEMNFQLELEKLLVTTPGSTETTEITINDSESKV